MAWLVTLLATAAAVVRPPLPPSRIRQAPLSCRQSQLRGCADSPPPPGAGGAKAVDAAASLAEQLGADDPIYQDELFLRGEDVRYGDGSSGAGTGYCTSYLPFTAMGNHSRAVLCLTTEPTKVGEASLRAFADRVALSCECVVLLPWLQGGSARWSHQRLAFEALAACRYVNGEYGVERLAVIALGSTSQTTLELLADGNLDAHAAVLLCPRELRGAARAARELQQPLLAICAEAAAEAELQQGLQLNSRLATDYFVASFGGSEPDFALRPKGTSAEAEAQRALALVQAWVDRYVPEVRDGE